MIRKDAVTFTEEGYFPSVPDSGFLVYDGALREAPAEDYGNYTDLPPEIRIIAAKAGTGIITHKDKRRTIYNTQCLAEDARELMEQGKYVIVVSSGAIGLGRKKRLRRGERIPEKEKNSAQQRQRDAEVGQYLLYTLWEHHLYPLRTSESLVVNSDLVDQQKRDNLFRGYVSDLERGRIPIINEDDRRTLEEIETQIEGRTVFRDNDGLWALICGNIGNYLTDELKRNGQGILGVNLTTTDGIYTLESLRNETYRPIRVVLNPEGLEQQVDEEMSAVGRGGGISKVLGLRDVTAAGGYAVIANGQYCNHDRSGKSQPREYRPFRAILEGKVIGTRALPGL